MRRFLRQIDLGSRKSTIKPIFFRENNFRNEANSNMELIETKIDLCNFSVKLISKMFNIFVFFFVKSKMFELVWESNSTLFNQNSRFQFIHQSIFLLISICCIEFSFNDVDSFDYFIQKLIIFLLKRSHSFGNFVIPSLHHGFHFNLQICSFSKISSNTIFWNKLFQIIIIVGSWLYHMCFQLIICIFKTGVFIRLSICLSLQNSQNTILSETKIH